METHYKCGGNILVLLAGTGVTGKVTTTAWRQKLMPEPLVNPLWIRDKHSGVVVFDRTQRSWPFYDRELPRISVGQVSCSASSI